MPVPWELGVEPDIAVATSNPLVGLWELVDDVGVEQGSEPLQSRASRDRRKSWTRARLSVFVMSPHANRLLPRRESATGGPANLRCQLRSYTRRALSRQTRAAR